MRKFLDTEHDIVITIEELRADFEELKEIDTQWKGYSLDEFIAWLLELGTIIEL